jgi:hypothetical protein
VFEVSDGPPAPLERRPTDWLIRAICPHARGGWELLVDAHDHGIWTKSPRSVVEYALLRKHAGYVLALCVHYHEGELRQVILHDARHEARKAFTRAASLTDDPALRTYLFKRSADST